MVEKRRKGICERGLILLLVGDVEVSGSISYLGGLVQEEDEESGAKIILNN